MLCSLTRWLISRAEDRGKKMPRFAERHAARCGACRQYARFADQLSPGLSGETPAFLAKAPDVPWNPVGLEVEASPKEARSPFRRRPALRPLPAAAAILFVSALAFLLFQVVRREPSPAFSQKGTASAYLKQITAAPDELRGAVEKADSLLDTERRILENSIVSAVEYLQARLDIRIEKRDVPGTL